GRHRLPLTTLVALCRLPRCGLTSVAEEKEYVAGGQKIARGPTLAGDRARRESDPRSSARGAEGECARPKSSCGKTTPLLLLGLMVARVLAEFVARQNF